jgi:hypothetical protein
MWNGKRYVCFGGTLEIVIVMVAALMAAMCLGSNWIYGAWRSGSELVTSWPCISYLSWLIVPKKM